MERTTLSRLPDGRICGFNGELSRFEVLTDGVWGPAAGVSMAALIESRPLSTDEIKALPASDTGAQ